MTVFAIFLAAAVISVAVFRKLGLGSVLGYLAAGALIGPSGLGLIHAVDEVLDIAELGIVLLLFLIGLELQPSRLWKMRSAVFGLGPAQVLGTTAVLGLVAKAFGLPWPAAFAVGVGLAMSSTAITTQLLGERGDLGKPYGRAAFGITLFQDVAAIPALAIIPLLGVAESQSKRSPLLQVGLVVVVVSALVIGGRMLLRPAFRFIAGQRSHELSTASALLVVLGTAMIVHSVGLSMALGSFLAGVLLADSEYRHELEANIEPFKDLLLGLFFIGVGMSANLALVVARPLLVLLLVLVLVFTKFVVLYVIGRTSKLGHQDAMSLGIAISAGGEFAFVIFSVASASHVLTPRQVELVVVVVTLSMVMTPLLFKARDKWLARRPTADKRAYDEIHEDSESKVIIAGFGRFGQVVGRVLRLKKITFTALDASAEHVDFLRRFGNKIYYGDASRADLLRAARADDASVFVLAIDDFEASMKTLRVVKESFPHLKIVARARNRQHAYALFGAGVELVVRETFAGSVEASRLTLEELGFPAADAKRTVKKFAEYDEAQVKKVSAIRDDEKAQIESAKKYSAELERIFEEDEVAENLGER